MKAAVNSNGEIVTLTSSQKEIRFIPQEIKEKELTAFKEDFVCLLNQKGIDTQGKGFCFMLQPFYTMERMLIFTKTEFSSSSQAVKLANEVEKHPEIAADKERYDFYKSIFPDNTSGRTRWYFLNVGYIAFERNLYDCVKINVFYRTPIPYAGFMRSFNSSLISQEERDKKEVCPKYSFFNNGIDIEDAETLLSQAFLRDISGDMQSKFDFTVCEALEEYKCGSGYLQKDKTSNNANACLMMINNGRQNIFPVYQKVKNCISKTFKGAYNISYRGNKISAKLADGGDIAIYVSGTEENPKFIVGGKMITGIEHLKKAMLLPTFRDETDWFVSKVKPNIFIEETKATVRKKPKDVIGWNKKRNKSHKKGK